MTGHSYLRALADCGETTCTATQSLHVPAIDGDADALTAALTYASAGLYVLPVRRGTKDPGSVVCRGWQHKSSRDPEQIAAWFAGTDHGIALHVGRSGALVFDVDDPDALPEVIAQHLQQAPFQSTRPDTPGRGHYIVAQPAGRMIGNSLGRLPSGWGDVRGRNGVIMVWPSVHPGGGDYLWQRIGPVLPLADELADKLDDANPASDAATDTEVTKFVGAHAVSSRPELLRGRVSQLEAKAAAGAGRHTAALPIVAGALEESAAGFYPAAAAIKELAAVFIAAVTSDGSRTEPRAQAEFANIVSWGVGQALAADVAEVRAGVALRMPRDDEDGMRMLVAPRLRATLRTVPPWSESPESPAPSAANPPAKISDHDARERAIAARLAVLHIDHEARRRFDEETRPTVDYPPVRDLAALLAEPDSDTEYRIEGLAPAEARVMLSAQFKAGKTTLVGNLAHSLVDGAPFLGRFAVNMPARRLVIIDDELSEHTLRRWLRAQNIDNVDAVADVVALRGKVATFNLLDDRCRTEWATRLRNVGCDYLMLDCLRPILDALGLDENRDAGRFLVAFDALLAEAGIGDALLVQHMGHANERARGDSRLQDWPDAIWRLVRENDEPDSPRYFTAYGRDVDVPEGRLDFDPVTRRLSFADGSRKAAKAHESAAEALHSVVTVLVEHALKDGAEVGVKVREIKQSVAGAYGIGNRRVDEALQKGLAMGTLSRRDGERKAVLYTLANPCATCSHPVTDPTRAVHRECEE